VRMTHRPANRSRQPLAAGRTVRLDDPAVVAEQYRDPSRLAARQAIWSWREPPLDFACWALGLVSLDGNELVVDVGCGDGQYLRELVRRGHRGHLVGIDVSAGMLAQVPARASRLVANAQALPLAGAVADLTLAMHMLYHVLGKQTAAGELRRVTKPAGRLVVALPGQHSLCELHQLVDRCAASVGLVVTAHDSGLTLDQAAVLFAGVFDTVERADAPGQLRLTDPDPVLGYVASLSRVLRAAPDPRQLAALLAAVREEAESMIAAQGCLALSATAGCLICR
jgi:SAM-dependent methyltransferase